MTSLTDMTFDLFIRILRIFKSYASYPIHNCDGKLDVGLVGWLKLT